MGLRAPTWDGLVREGHRAVPHQKTQCYLLWPFPVFASLPDWGQVEARPNSWTSPWLLSLGMVRSTGGGAGSYAGT
jgi:hypothetical protein